jgi:hypothetical protein
VFVVGCRIVVSSRRHVVLVAQSSSSRCHLRRAVVFVPLSSSSRSVVIVAQSSVIFVAQSSVSRSRHRRALVFIAQSSSSRSRLRPSRVVLSHAVRVAPSESRRQVAPSVSHPGRRHRRSVEPRSRAVVIVTRLTSSSRHPSRSVAPSLRRRIRTVPPSRRPSPAGVLSRCPSRSVAPPVVALSCRRHNCAVTPSCRRAVRRGCTLPSHAVAPSRRRAAVAMLRSSSRRHTVTPLRRRSVASSEFRHHVASGGPPRRAVVLSHRQRRSV